MENMIGLAVALVVGLAAGFYLGRSFGAREAAPADSGGEEPAWWDIRQTLTGTQLQILQFMEAKKEAPIEELQEKFSFIPDRELYYRLEQICLMNFVKQSRKGGVMTYTLNPDYEGTVEGDKTVMLG